MADRKNLRAQEVLQMFLFERVLVRLASSAYKDNFILKGGLLISSMIGIGERTTMDMDTTVRGIRMEEDEIVKAVKKIISADVGDGIKFEYESIEPIREDDAYNNFRIHLRAKYGKIDSPMKIDITTGDVITPAAIQYDFPMLFEEKFVPVMAYTLETILAEKYETILRRNVGTTRARDYYDIHTLFRSRKNEIRPDVLREAVLHTAKKRDSVKDIEDWREILSDIKDEPLMQNLWNNYVSENPYIGELSFDEVLKTVAELAEFLDENEEKQLWQTDGRLLNNKKL